MSQTLTTPRFNLRPLTPLDASDKYLSWFAKNNASEYISYNNDDITALQQYITTKQADPNCWFYGIFTQEQQIHIGNIKFEKHPEHSDVVTLGILIGDKTYQGKGVASEVINEFIKFFKQDHNIKVINLGVAKQNTAAIKAYEKIGFTHTDTGYYQFANNSIEMLLTV